MSSMWRKLCWLSSLLLLLQAACAPKHQLGGKDSLDEIQGNDGENEDHGGSGPRLGSKDDATAAVHVPFDQLPSAVIERNNTGIVHQQVDVLRQKLCKGQEDRSVIFYRLIVSSHWHYYWLCSGNRARRASSRLGAQHIRKWLNGFRGQAARLAGACTTASRKAVLRGTHKSGVRSVAYCNGEIVLHFPDGQKTVKRIDSEGQTAAADASCPPCPTVSHSASNCPRPRPCAACPRPKPCPTCTNAMVEAGKKGFIQGVAKACSRICGLIYTECRRINSKTALCYMLQEYCTKNCSS